MYPAAAVACLLSHLEDTKQKLKCRKYKAKKHAATLRDNSVSHKTLASGRVQLLPGQLGIKAVHTMRLWAAYVTN